VKRIHSRHRLVDSTVPCIGLDISKYLTRKLALLNSAPEAVGTTERNSGLRVSEVAPGLGRLGSALPQTLGLKWCGVDVGVKEDVSGV